MDAEKRATWDATMGAPEVIAHAAMLRELQAIRERVISKQPLEVSAVSFSSNEEKEVAAVATTYDLRSSPKDVKRECLAIGTSERAIGVDTPRSAEYRDLIPQEIFVSTAKDYEVIVPDAPTINPALTDTQYAWLLRSWYEGAALVMTGKQCWSFRSERCRDIPKSKHYPLLMSTLAKLKEHSIAPALWIMWSFRMWASSGKRSLPPIKFVFSPNRIELRYKWFMSETDTGMPGAHHVVISQRKRAFLQRESDMRRAVRVIPWGTPRKAIHATVERYWPEGTRERELAALREEAQVLNAKLREQIENGVWVWGKP